MGVEGGQDCGGRLRVERLPGEREKERKRESTTFNCSCTEKPTLNVEPLAAPLPATRHVATSSRPRPVITVANQLHNATTHQRNQFEALAHSMRSAMGHNKEIATCVTRAQEDLSPLFVIELFKRISDEDCELLWLEVR